MLDSIVNALAEHRDVAALIAALPATLRCLVEFDYMSLFLDGAIAGAAGWYVPADADRPVVALIPTTDPPSRPRRRRGSSNTSSQPSVPGSARPLELGVRFSRQSRAFNPRALCR